MTRAEFHLATVLVADNTGRLVVIAKRDEDACGETRRGWLCSLLPRHAGKHEAWCTDPAKLILSWPLAKKRPAEAKRKAAR
jgi:hypothetical protein